MELSQLFVKFKFLGFDKAELLISLTSLLHLPPTKYENVSEEKKNTGRIENMVERISKQQSKTHC